MHEILLALVRVIAPILCFTADEIWRAMPPSRCAARPAARRACSSPTSRWPTRPGRTTRCWRAGSRLWEIRGVVTKALEEQRRDGPLGQSLEARVTLAASRPRRARCSAPIGERGLCEMFIVSQVEVAAGDGELAVDGREGPRRQVRALLELRRGGRHLRRPPRALRPLPRRGDRAVSGRVSRAAGRADLRARPVHQAPGRRRAGRSASRCRSIPGFFSLTYVRNRGGAFGLFSDLPEAWRVAFFVVFAVATVARAGLDAAQHAARRRRAAPRAHRR